MPIEEAILTLAKAIDRNTDMFIQQSQVQIQTQMVGPQTSGSIGEVGTVSPEAKTRKPRTPKTSAPAATQPEHDTAAPQQLPVIGRGVVDEAVKAVLAMPDGKPLAQAIIKKFAARLDDVDPNRYAELVDALDEARKAKIAADEQAADDEDVLDDM